MRTTVLILPGLFNSGEDHWQTQWEKRLPNVRRIQQRNWDAPHRADWVSTLDKAIASIDGSVILAAHSLGCALVAWWVRDNENALHAAKVKGALLVAPPDVERPDFPKAAVGFAPMPGMALPFPAIVVASSDDPWCDLPKARSWAAAWGAEFQDIGPCGHINGDSRLDDWPRGMEWLSSLQHTHPTMK